MSAIVAATGASDSHFLMACMLMHSLRQCAPEVPCHVLDFGLSEPRRRFLKRHGQLRDRPARLAADLHPYHYKAAMAEYLSATEWSALTWLDSDMIAVGPLGARLETLVGEMADTGRDIAVCEDAVGSIAKFLAGGFDAAPFAERLRAEGINPARPYFNVGVLVCRSPQFMREWIAMVEQTRKHVCFEQNMFNVLVHRGPPPMVLDAAAWNLHGGALAHAQVTDQGEVRVPGAPAPTLLLHPTSTRIEDVALHKAIAVGRERIAAHIRRCTNPALWRLQLTHLRQFLFEAWDDLWHGGLVLDPRATAWPQPIGLAPAAALPLSNALRFLGVGRWAEAEAQLATVEKFGPVNSDLLGVWALACHYLERFPEAIALSRRAQQGSQPAWRAHLVEGMALLKLGRAAEAVASLERAAAIDPRSAQAEIHRAAALAATGALEPALSAATAATRLAPDLFGGWRQRALILEALGRSAEAAADRECAMALVNVV